MASDNSHPFLMDRRTYLTVAGGAAASTPFVGTAAADGHEYNVTVDIVEAGADNTGQEPINPILEDIFNEYGDDVYVKFPEGEYAMDSQFRLTGFNDVAFVGDNATIVPTDDFDMSRPRLFRLGIYYEPGTDLLFEGFTVDFTASDTGMRVIEAQITTDLTVRDIRVEGEHDSGRIGPALFDLLNDDGRGLIERFEIPDGGEFSKNTSGDIARGPTGILVSSSHKGTLRFRDCVVGPFPDNGLYAASGTGRVLVQGGRFENSNIASVRLGGDGSKIRDATVVVDQNRSEDVNQRGIRLDYGSNLWVENVNVQLAEPNGHAITVMNDVESARIEGTSVTIGDRINHGIVVYSEAGPTDIVRTDIEINGGGYAIQITGEDAGTVVCEHVTVTGDASGEGGRSAIWCGRNNCEFRALDIDQPGTNDRRAIVVWGDDCLLVFGNYVARDFPIVNKGSGTRIYDLSAASYDNREALWLKDGQDIEIVRNELENGIRNDGATIAKQYGNVY